MASNLLIDDMLSMLIAAVYRWWENEYKRKMLEIVKPTSFIRREQRTEWDIFNCGRESGYIFILALLNMDKNHKPD